MGSGSLGGESLGVRSVGRLGEAEKCVWGVGSNPWFPAHGYIPEAELCFRKLLWFARDSRSGLTQLVKTGYGDGSSAMQVGVQGHSSPPDSHGEA